MRRSNVESRKNSGEKSFNSLKEKGRKDEERRRMKNRKKKMKEDERRKTEPNNRISLVNRQVGSKNFGFAANETLIRTFRSRQMLSIHGKMTLTIHCFAVKEETLSNR